MPSGISGTDEGRFTPELVRWVRGLAGELMDRLDADDRWWDETWADWVPPLAWSSPGTR